MTKHRQQAMIGSLKKLTKKRDTLENFKAYLRKEEGLNPNSEEFDLIVETYGCNDEYSTYYQEFLTYIKRG